MSHTRNDVFTIGYEGTSLERVLSALTEARVELVADVRAVTSSRRPGFSKNQLAANLAEAGIGYLHLRGLGTPSEGRAAARSGDDHRLREIYTAHLGTIAAESDLRELAAIVASGKRTCLLCYEADPERCHRTMVTEALAPIVPLKIVHLKPT